MVSPMATILIIGKADTAISNSQFSIVNSISFAVPHRGTANT